MGEMVKRVTEAVTKCRVDAYGTDEDIARAAIEAIREPTEAMVHAFRRRKASEEPWDRDLMDMWQEAIDIALDD